ncbi:hypothetical protein F4823DRAFT_588249 [Ustulina deusta]|nr:hypothetical protein F4823DRAFT_588249 [Ustulina deusta]
MDIFEARRNVRKLEAEIDRLQEEDVADARQAGNQASWWGNMSSFLFGAGSEGAGGSQEAKEERERRRLNRSAAIRIKSMEMLNKTNRLHALETAAESTAMAIEELKQQIRVEEQKQEDERAAQAQRKMQEEYLRRAREAEAERRRKREQEERERNEWERKRREQREREQNEREQKERERVEREKREFSLREEIMRKERERVQREFHEQLKKAAESRKGASKQQHWASKSADKPQSACLHRGWWTQIPGRAVCSICSKTLAKFALECPGCHMKACATCKRTMQGRR